MNDAIADLKKLLKPWPLLIFIAILALYFFTRLFHLTLIPVFVDEAIYVRWSQIMRNEPSLRFLPLQDGKQPLFMWLTIPIFKLFTDPLFAGRFVSVLAGLGSLLGIMAICWLISRSARVIIAGALLYIFIPFTLFFDRMALADSLLSMFGLFSILLGLLLVRYPRLDLSMLLGFTIGGAVLTKSPGWYFLAMQPILLLTAKKVTRKTLLQLLGGWLVAAIIALGMYNILRLGPNFHLIALRNKDYVFPLAEVLQHPLNPFIGHFTDSVAWTISLLTWPAIALLFISLSLKPFRTAKYSLFLWSLLPILFQAAIAKAYTSRYFLFAILPLLIIISLTLEKLKGSTISKAVISLFSLTILFALYKDFFLLTNPPAVPIPQNMKYGYFQEWTAGYGQKQVAQYLKARPTTQKILVGTEGFFGTLPDGLQIYTQDHPNIIVIGIGQPVGKIPSSLRDGLVENEVYLVVNQSRNNLPPIDLQNHVKLIAQYPKPDRPDGTHETLQFYQILK